MNAVLRYVLLGDGGRDAALRYVIDWAIQNSGASVAPELIAFRKHSYRVEQAVASAVRHYAPELVFVHRDAEAATLAVRRAEIRADGGRIVRVVPVRMTEAWLLIDEAAIRSAAGHRSGTTPLCLPRADELEYVPDAKETLSNALLAASALSSGRRRRRFRRDEAEWPERVASVIDDFSPLRRLPAFQAFETELRLRLDEWRATAPEPSPSPAP